MGKRRRSIMNSLWLLLFVTGVLSQEQFQCGTDKVTTEAAYTAIMVSCPQKLAPVNHCCVVHDACYDQYPGPTKQQCDDGFCACIRATQCGGEVPAFCTIVRIAGEAAFRNARIASCKKQARDEREIALCDQMMLQSSNEKVEKGDLLELFMEERGMEYNCLNPLSQVACGLMLDALLKEDGNASMENLCSCLSNGLRSNSRRICHQGYNNICPVF